MQKIEASSPAAQSADLVNANIEQLKRLFPELITEGVNGVAVNIDVLKSLVGDKTAMDGDEKYGLIGTENGARGNWHLRPVQARCFHFLRRASNGTLPKI